MAQCTGEEIGPTAVQLREVMSTVNQLRGATEQRISAVSHKVEDVAGTLGTAVNSAHKHSSVWGTGLLAGQFTAPFNLAGFPAISIPCGFTRTGLPIGLQLVAPPWCEARLLQAARAYEREVDWESRHPDVV